VITEEEAQRREKVAHLDGFRMGVNWLQAQLLDTIRIEHHTAGAADEAWKVSETRQLMETPR
jgi:hypothetical protein